MLESSLARPRTTVLRHEAYPGLHDKAAAILHSFLPNRCLIDGNKRLGWLAAVVFCYINGSYIDAPHDDVFDLVIAIADGSVHDVAAIAAKLKAWSRSP